MEKISYLNETLLADNHEVLDLSFLKPIWEIISKIDKWESVEWIKWWKNIYNWYNDYKVMYWYSDLYNKKTPKQLEIIQEISSKKNNSDIMNLVEIAIWRLVEKYFNDKFSNVRVRKTSLWDDYFWSIDYILEFKDSEWEIESAVWVDLTVIESINNIELDRRLLEKKKKKTTKPMDYIKYINWTNKWNIQEIPRIILHFNKDIAYHFTNNYFADVFEKWKILSNDEINSDLDYAIDDYNDFRNINTKRAFDINQINYKIIELIDESKKCVNTVLKNK